MNNLDQLQRFILRATNASPERKACRALLKQAKKGDQEQFLALASHYIALVQAYFGNCLHEEQEIRAERTCQIFISLWQRISYAERVSDFEYMLACSLIDNAPDGPVESEETIVTRLRLMAPHVRFAFLATELDQWPLRWVALVLRIRTQLLHRILAQARCELCDIPWDSLSKEEQDKLEAVSAGLEKCLDVKANKALAKRLAAYPRISEIKAQWLELRPEIVEIRHKYLPSSEQNEAILKQILTGIADAPMRKPALVDRLVNTVHFSRHSRIKVS